MAKYLINLFHHYRLFVYIILLVLRLKLSNITPENVYMEEFRIPVL